MLLTAFVAPAPALDAPRVDATAETSAAADVQGSARRPARGPRKLSCRRRRDLRRRRCATPPRAESRWRNGSSAACTPTATASLATTSRPMIISRRIVEHFADDEPDPRERSMAASAFVAVGVYLRDGLARRQDRAGPRPRLRSLPLCGDLFPQRRRAVQSRAHVSRRRRREEEPAPERQLAGARRPQGPSPGAGGARPADVQRRGRRRAAAPARIDVSHPGARRRRRRPPRDQWIVDLYAKAMASASEADRKAAVAMLEGYLRERN